MVLNFRGFLLEVAKLGCKESFATKKKIKFT
jgi:hypothetical protein